jgi:hypothetical protein
MGAAKPFQPRFANSLRFDYHASSYLARPPLTGGLIVEDRGENNFPMWRLARVD